MRSIGQKITPCDVALLVIVFAGLLLRVVSLTTQSLSPDEIFSVVLARTTVSQIVQDTAKDVHPPLYYLALHSWSYLFSTSEFAVRLPSVIFGVAAIPVIYLLGCSLFDKQVGLASAFILAFSPFNITYSQEARMYSLMLLFTLVSMYFFVRLLERRSYWVSAGYVLSTALLLYTHVLGLAVLVAQNIFVVLVVLLSRERTVGLKSWVVHQALIIVLFIPWVGIEINASQRAIKPWLEPNTVLQTLTDHAGSSLLLLLFVVLAVFSLFTVRQIPSSQRWKTSLKGIGNHSFDFRLGNVKNVSFPIVWLLTLNLLPLAISTYSGYQLYLSKYVIAGSAALYLIVAAGIRNINSYAKLGVLCVIAILSVASVQTYYITPTHPGSRAVMSYISDNARDGDVVIVYPVEYGVIFQEYYQVKGVAIVPFPSHSVYNETWIKDPSVNMEDLRSDVGGHNRVWFIDFSQHNKYLDSVRNRTLKALNESYEITHVENFFRYSVYSFENQTQ